MYNAKLITHKGENRIAVYFENKAELIARFKKLKGCKWSASLKVWHLPDNTENRIKFKLPKKIIGYKNMAKIHSINQKAYQTYIDIL